MARRKLPEYTREFKPENSGKQNLVGMENDPLMAKENSADAQLTKKLVALMNLRRGSNSSKWTEEDFDREITEFFEYCAENDLNPSPALLRIWIHATAPGVDLIRRSPSHPGYDAICLAYDLMESKSDNKLEKYPVGNIFRLKAYHGVVEQTKPEEPKTVKLMVDSESAKEAITKLGLEID